MPHPDRLPQGNSQVGLGPRWQHAGHRESGRLIQLREVPSGKLRHGLKRPGKVLDLIWRPDGKTLIGIHGAGRGKPGQHLVLLWDAATGQLLSRHKVTGPLAWSSDRKVLAYRPEGQTVAFWDLDGKRLLRPVVLKDLPAVLPHLAWSRTTAPRWRRPTAPPFASGRRLRASCCTPA